MQAALRRVLIAQKSPTPILTKWHSKQSFFLASHPTSDRAHVHHASFEVNDTDTQQLGHDWLRARLWTNCWGVGRHVLGSQVFDYW